MNDNDADSEQYDEEHAQQNNVAVNIPPTVCHNDRKFRNHIFFRCASHNFSRVIAQSFNRLLCINAGVFGARNIRHAVSRQLINGVRVIDYNAVPVYEKSVAVLAVALAQNLNQAVDIKINGEDTYEFIFITENKL